MIKRFFQKLLYVFKAKYPPGHYSSPIMKREEILRREKQIFNFSKENIRAVEFNEKEQLELIEKFKQYYNEIPFQDARSGKLRYSFDNTFFSYSDAIFLYCIIRYFRPRRIVEIGSGFSSAVMLDTADLYFNGQIQCSFIEPYPERLLRLLNENDKKNHQILKAFVQDVDLAFFDELGGNDVLFIDSSHVSKTGSDVNHILFNILPRLNKGVLIHFHDIFYPFEYPKPWVLEGRSWNEGYLLRAFLSYNKEFEIIAFNTFLEYHYEDWFKENMPLCLEDTGGSIWLRKK